MRIDKALGITATGGSLEFVLIDSVKDIPLFLDPYKIEVLGTPRARKASRELHTFFQKLLSVVKSAGLVDAADLLRDTVEKNQLHLGYSNARSRGNSLGTTLALDLARAFSSDPNLTSGRFSRLAELPIVIPHISNDRISDMTAAIIMDTLLEFNREIIRKYGLTSTSTIPKLRKWCSTRQEWCSASTSPLPCVGGSPVILVPKDFVNRKISMNSYGFWMGISSLKEIQRRATDHPTAPKLSRTRLRQTEFPTVQDQKAHNLRVISQDSSSNLLEQHAQQLRSSGKATLETFEEMYAKVTRSEI